MKVLLVLGHNIPFPGAAWTRVGYFADSWTKQGHEVSVLGTFSPKTISKRGVVNHKGVRIHNNIFSLDLDNPAVFIFNLLSAFVASTFFLLTKRPSVVVISFPRGDIGLGVLVASRLSGIKCSVDYRDEWEDYAISLSTSMGYKKFYSIIKRFASFLYSNSQLVVAVTQHFSDSLSKRGIPRVNLIPNGADLQTFKPLPSEQRIHEGFRIFFGGYIGCYYRLDIAVKAIAILIKNGETDVKLVFAGEGDVNSILALASQLNISRNIEYLGIINDKSKLTSLMNTSDLGLIPYDNNPLWRNSLPAKLFEYCACSLPIVATAHSDSLIAQLIDTENLGVVSPPLDVDKLAAAIETFYSNTELREYSARRTRIFVEQNFDRDKAAKAYISLLKTYL